MGEELSAKPRVGFIQLQKYNKDTGEFEGVMASSAPDQSNEVLDWATSKPHFQRWFNDSLRRSKGASLGNVREMHQPVAAGKLTWVKFDDEHERLFVKGRVIDPSTKVKIEEAVLTGLSIGGDYGKKWADPLRAGFMRYEAKPYEVSLVDNPCNPDAVLTLTSAQGEPTMVKFASAAALEFEADDDPTDTKLDKFTVEPALPASADRGVLTASDYAYVPDPAQPSTWRFPIDTPARVRSALERYATVVPTTGRRKAWAKIVRAATKFGIEISPTHKGASMSPDEIVGNELRKQEQFKAQVREALFSEKGLLKRVKRVRKQLKAYIETFGEKGGLNKSYVSTISGVLNDLSGQIASLQAAFTPAVAAGMPSSPGNSQPGENVGGGDGDMVTASPSSSGTGAMIPGVGVRAAAGAKGGKLSKKKLLKILAENNAEQQRGIAELIASILKPPTADETAALVKAMGGEDAYPAKAPMRLVKEAPDADKVKATGGALEKGAAAAADDPSDAVITALQQQAADVTDPLKASRARAELDKITEGAVRKALQGAKGTETGGNVAAAGFRK